MFEEKLSFKMEGLKSRITDMSDYGPDWGGNKQMLIEARDKSSFGLDLHGLKEPLYNIVLYYTKGPDYGNADVYLNDIKAGSINGYSPHILPNGKVSLTGSSTLTGWAPRSGSFNLRFVVIGKNAASKGYNIGLDGFGLEPQRIYIPEWYVIGPFPNPRKSGAPRRGLDSIYIPEVYVDLNKEYYVNKGKPIHWNYVQTPLNGYVSLCEKVYPNEMVVAYAVTYIYSTEKKKVVLFVGSDDGIKVFFNDKVVYRLLGDRIAEPDQAEIELNMNPGWNKLLLKVENNLGQFAFYARLLDVGNKLIISSEKKIPSEN